MSERPASALRSGTNACRPRNPEVRMKPKPVVSVITPLYNCAVFVAETIRSVQAQTVADWEMIVVDDCSTDDSAVVVRSFAEDDSRIKLISLGENSGPAVARNTGIESALGRFMAFIDSDDQWLPRKLEKQLDFMDANGYRITHTRYAIITESGSRTNKVVSPPDRLSYEDMLKSNQMGCLTVMYDAERLGKVYMPLIRRRQDYGLWLKLLKIESFAWCLPDTLALYRNRIGSVSKNKMEMMRYNWRLYRDMEKLSVLKSGYYLGWNIVRKLSV